MRGLRPRPWRRPLAWLRRWLQPSLGRRLLLAQMAMLTSLWTLFIVGLIYAAHVDNELLTSDPVFDLVISIADNLADAPERQQQSLQAFNNALNKEYGDGVDDGRFTPVVLVWQRGELIYRSAPSVPAMHNTRLGEVEEIEADGKVWRLRTQQSPRNDTQVSIALPEFKELLITFHSRGYYLLPLLISLPFLAFPAWWSVRLALRPWRRVSDEIAMRGPNDLAPLTDQPRHAELQPFVQNINTLLQRVRDSAARERSLIADAAHELRTPLAAMRVNVEALRQQASDARQRELMDSLLRSNQRATRMVSQLLQLMRSDAATDSDASAVLRLDALVQDRLAVLDGLAAASGVELELAAEEALSIWGERESLVSMIDNLVDNAIKYSPRGATVLVRLVRQGASALLSVADAGPGIPPHLHARVFDRFFRVPDQAQSGSGLGLAIVKAAVDKHGGQIALDGAGGGLRVCVTLPLADSPAA
ncbi:MAG: sensor histidine kinase [Acidovorax sp.]|nr:sensor histidine kinase [Acidovorax sp.]